MLAYHVTPIENLPEILRAGLVPKIGPRSEELGEDVPAIYCFASMKELDAGLANWLGEALEDVDGIAIIEIEVPDDAISHDTAGAAFWEIKLHDPVSPDRFRRILQDDAEGHAPFSQEHLETIKARAAKALRP